eukprot:1149086-Prymnesium_polylepis.1
MSRIPGRPAPDSPRKTRRRERAAPPRGATRRSWGACRNTRPSETPMEGMHRGRGRAARRANGK